MTDGSEWVLEVADVEQDREWLEGRYRLLSRFMPTRFRMYGPPSRTEGVEDAGYVALCEYMIELAGVQVPPDEYY